MRSGSASSARSLVTGAGGFIGHHLTATLLQAGGRVIALDRDLARARALAGSDRLELLEGDFVDPEIQRRALDEVDTVYHLAAAHLGASIGRAEFWRVNVDGLRVFAESAARAGIRRFVHCSSVGVYGRIDAPPADEDSPCHPALPYEESKLAGERVILETIDRCGLSAVVLRPAWVYGTGCPRTERLFRSIGKGRFVVAGSGRALRHCVYIRDMVHALRLAAHADAALGQVIIIGDAGAVPVRQLVDAIANLTGARRPLSVPLPLLTLAAVMAEMAFRPLGREPPISRRTLEFFRANTSFRIERAKRLLGFEPSYDLASGLRETHRLLAKSSPAPGPFPGASAGSNG